MIQMHLLSIQIRDFTREVIITQILYEFDDFFKGWSWFKLFNLIPVLGITLKFYSCVEKLSKLRVKSVEGN